MYIVAISLLNFCRVVINCSKNRKPIRADVQKGPKTKHKHRSLSPLTVKRAFSLATTNTIGQTRGVRWQGRTSNDPVQSSAAAWRVNTNKQIIPGIAPYNQMCKHYTGKWGIKPVYFSAIWPLKCTLHYQKKALKLHLLPETPLCVYCNMELMYYHNK